MSGGFFRGTSADQDTRFSNKQAKLLKTQKFASELEHLVDITKVKMDVIKPWIARRVTELIGFEDEVLINFIYGLLDGKEINGKEVQIQLTGFMEKNTGKFMKELWALLLSAQNNSSGVPQQFLDAKEEETRKKKEETDRIFNEIQRRREKETKEAEHEKARKMDDGLDNNYAEESNRRAERGPDIHSGDENGAGVTNGFRGRKSSSKSPYSSDRSPSPRRVARSRSISKSFSDSRSRSKEKSMSRSISDSPRARRRSYSPERMRSSPRRRSVSPKRRSARESTSPRRRSHSGRRSSSRTRHRSPSPLRHRVHSPIRRRRSPSPLRRRSPSYGRRRSPSPRRWSRSPVRRRSPSSRRYRSPSPRHHRSRSPWWRQSPSLRRRRSPTPRRRRQRSTSSSRSRSPVQRRPVSPPRRRYQSPIRRRSPFPARRRSPTPNRRSLSPWARKPQSPGRSRSSSPVRRRSPVPARRRAPVWSPNRSQSPASGGSASPIRRHSVESPVKTRSPRVQKSPHGPPRGKTRIHEAARMDHRQPISLSPQRDHADRNSSRRKVPSISPSRDRSASYSESPRTRTVMRLASPYESHYNRPEDRRTFDDSQSSPAKLRDRKSHHGSPVRTDEGMQDSREDGDKKSIGKGSVRSSGGKNKESPDGPFIRRHHDGTDLRKGDEIRSEEAYIKEARASKKSPHKGSVSKETHDVLHTGNIPKSDERRSSHSKDAKENMRPDSLLDSRKKNGQRSLSVDSDSGAEGSDKLKAGVVEKRKHRRSSRREAASDDTSSDSEPEDRKEAKRRRKEEKKIRKEERRRRREERRRRREEKRASKRRRKSKDADLSSSDMEKDEKNAYASIGERRSRKYSSDEEETESQKKRLEIELREKALESLRAKKNISR